MEVEKKMTSIFYFKKYLEEIIMETYEEFINNILETRGRFACGEEYHERHHIVPKCIGGSNDEDNLIGLFAREHFEAHRLLALENPEVDSLVYAWWNMSHINKANGRNYEISSEEYEEAKIAFSIMHSKRLKGMFAGEKNYFYDTHMYGDKNPMFGKHHTEESKKKNSESNKANWTDDKRKSFGEIRKGRNNPNSRMIYQYDKNGNFIRVWGSISDTSRSLNIDVSNISACARGKYKTAGGYIWRYTPDYLNN